MLTILLYNVVYISKKKQWLIQQRRANGETIVEKLKPQNVKNSKRFMFGGRSLKSEERNCYLRGEGGGWKRTTRRTQAEEEWLSQELLHRIHLWGSFRHGIEKKNAGSFTMTGGGEHGRGVASLFAGRK